jgi:hypothetical protein
MKEINTPIHQAVLSVRHHRQIAVYTMLFLLNVLLFTYTSPLESSAAIVIIGLLLISLDLIVIAHFCVRFLCLLVPSVRVYRRRLTVALASFAIVATALASLGQLTWRDIVVVVIIGLIGYMYSLRFRLGMK